MFSRFTDRERLRLVQAKLCNATFGRNYMRKSIRGVLAIAMLLAPLMAQADRGQDCDAAVLGDTHLATVTVTDAQRQDLINQCTRANIWPWFVVAVYAEARKARYGLDSHEVALREYDLFIDSVHGWTIADYAFSRILTPNTETSFEIRAQALRDTVALRRRYRQY